MSTLNADGQTSPKTPSVNVVSIAGEHRGQVFLPLEYPIASQMPLTQPGTGTTTAVTKNMLLEMYLEKTRSANTFGNVLQTASTVLGKLSIPANPYLTAANTFLSFANQTIQTETKDSGAQLFATLTFQFADRAYTSVQDCQNAGDSETGAIAVIAAAGNNGSNLLTLGNLDQRYCWRYNLGSTYEIQYAAKPTGSCTTVPDNQWNEPSNDYTMLFLSADTIPKKGGGYQALTVNDLDTAAKHVDDLKNARALCDSFKASRTLCGVN